jgi:hypothetical protein
MMELRKISVFLLALLLAAMAVVPIVSAADETDLQLIKPEIQTIDESGSKLPGGSIIPHIINAEKYDNPLTKEEFLANNKEYTNFLASQIGYDAAIKKQNGKYEKLITDYEKVKKEQTDLKATVSTTILEIWNADIYIWPWESQIKSTSDPNANPMTYVVIGNSYFGLKSYLLNNGWHQALGDSEWGLSGSSLSLLNWNEINSMYQVEKGNPLTYRYHALIHVGSYSSDYKKYWTYGECHYDYWNGNDHIILANGFDTGESQLYSTLAGSYSAYSTYFSNPISGYFNGNGHIFYI